VRGPFGPALFLSPIRTNVGFGSKKAKCGRHVSNVPILLQKSAAADQAFVPLERGDDAHRWPIFLKDTKGLDITTGSGVSIQEA
jgi:hypothetical protein